MLRLTGILTEFTVYRQLSYCTQILRNSLKSSASQEENVERREIIVDNIIKPEEQTNEKISNLLAKATDISTLLSTVANAKKNSITYAFQALDILANWTVDGKVKFVDVENDISFPEFLSVVEKYANYKNVSEIIKALENLIQMGVSNDNFLIESLENDLLWNIRRVTINMLLKILEFQAKYQYTDKQKKVLETTVETIERRWTEVTYFHDFVMIYENSKYFKPNFIGHIDDRVIENAENMGILGLSKIFCALSASKRRPTPVLRSLSFHMFKSNDHLTPKQSVNLIYAMNSLNYSDQALLDKLATDLLPQVEKINQSNILGSLLLCMGKMRWREKLLLDAIGEWVGKNFDSCRVIDLTNLIIALASVSYLPPSINDCFSQILTCISRTEVSDKATWVDVVWSLVILGKATNELISSILDPEFANNISADDPAHVGLHLKILNINAYVKYLTDSYDGPILKVPSIENLLITQSRKDRSLQAYVQKVLHNFLPPPKYIRENVRTTSGFSVDAEIIIDKNKRPISLEQIPSNFNGEYKQSLPEGCQRIAIMVWNFKDYTIGSTELTGFNPFIVKILQKLGYRVLQIPYFDINETGKIVKSVQYVQKRIKDIDE